MRRILGRKNTLKMATFLEGTTTKQMVTLNLLTIKHYSAYQSFYLLFLAARYIVTHMHALFLFEV